MLRKRLIVAACLVVITISMAVLAWHVFWVLPHMLATNEYRPSERVLLGFVRIPNDMDPYRGLVALKVARESQNVPWMISFIPPRYTHDRIRVHLEYWTKGGKQKKVRESHYLISCDPDGTYHGIAPLHEIALYDRSDQGELLIIAIVQLQVPRLRFPPATARPDDRPSIPAEPKRFDLGPRIS